MKLTPDEIRALLPLLRPNVRIEIVLHVEDKTPVPHSTAPVEPKRRSTLGWTPERRAEHAQKISDTKQRKKAEKDAAQVIEPEPEPEPEPAPVALEQPVPPITNDVKHVDRRQVSVIREAIRQAKQYNSVSRYEGN